LIERVRCPRAAARHCRSRAASDIMPAGTMTGTRGARCNRGRRRRGVTRCLSAPRSTKPGPKLSLRDAQSLGQEPRWNADRRAAPILFLPVRGGLGWGQCRARARRFRNSVYRRSASCYFSNISCRFPIVIRPADPPPDAPDEDRGYGSCDCLPADLGARTKSAARE
jgi:hypothetical protein